MHCLDSFIVTTGEFICTKNIFWIIISNLHPQADLIKNQALSQAKGLYTPQILGERIDMAAYFFF